MVAPQNRFLVGLNRHKSIFARTLLEVLGAIWLVLSLASFSFAGLRSTIEGNQWIFVIAIVSAFVIAIWRASAPNSVRFAVPGSNSEIEILFGELFEKRNEHVIVPVNSHFDGELGSAVDAETVHGQLIQRFYNSSGKAFEKACDAKLRGIDSEVVAARARRKRSYPIGTTLALQHRGRVVFVFALTRTEPSTFKATADVLAMWEALSGLWKCVRDSSNGHTVNLPLIGAGQSGVGPMPTHLLRLILLSICMATREREVCKCFRIVLHPRMFEKIDLVAVEKEWS